MSLVFEPINALDSVAYVDLNNELVFLQFNNLSTYFSQFNLPESFHNSWLEVFREDGLVYLDPLGTQVR